MNTTEFRTNPDKRKALRQLLDSPVFREAVALVKESLEPKINEPAVNTVRKVSLFDNRAGMNALLDQLELFTTAPQERKAPRIRELAKTVDDLPNQPEE